MSRGNRYLYLTGGLGNQLFQYAFALSDSRDRQLIIDAELGWPVIGKNDLPVLFEYELNQSVEMLNLQGRMGLVRKLGFFCIKLSSTSNRIYSHTLTPLLRPLLSMVFSLYYGRSLKVFIARGVGFYTTTLARKHEMVIGYFQSFHWPSLSHVKNELVNLKLVAPSSELTYYEGLAQTEKPLVVHIRLGDYLAEKSFGIPSPSYYQTAITELFDRNKHKKIWVFTNDHDGAKKILPHEFMKDIRWIPNVAESAAETLEVMRLGHDYIIANSTYSWWGAFLSKNQEASVIAPTPWFKEGVEPKHLCPPNWKRIAAWPQQGKS